MMDFRNFFESTLALTHPLFALEDDLEAFGLLVEDDKATIFSRKEDSRLIFFPDSKFRDLWEKYYGKGFFKVSMDSFFGRNQYQWVPVKSSEKSKAEIDSLKALILNCFRNIECYEKAKAPLYRYCKGGIRILEIHGFKSEFWSSFKYYIPVNPILQIGFNVPRYVEVKKFAFFWEMDQENIYLNIKEKNGPIIFGKFPDQILAMIFPTKKKIREIFEYKIV